MHKASAALEDIYQQSHQAVENPAAEWLPRTPAMAAGLTDHIWTLKEVFSMVVIGKQHSTG